MKTLVVNYSTWDDGDQVITIRPEKALAWADVPVGPCLSKAKADIVCEWLKCAMPTLQKIIVQTENDPTV